MPTRIPKMKILTMSNPKVLKGVKFKTGGRTFLPAVLMLSPGKRSGYQMCPFASPGCLRACLNTAGHGKEEWASSVHVHAARKRRTLLYHDHRGEFFRILRRDIDKMIDFCRHHKFLGFERHVRKNGKHVLIPAFEETSRGTLVPVFRLNGTSDIAWERIKVPAHQKSIIELYPRNIFYDYTKIPGRYNRPPNYHLTYSHHENYEREGRLMDSTAIAAQYMSHGVNTAYVFNVPKDVAMITEYKGIPVIDGAEHDLRFLDPPGHIVGLYPLEKAKNDTSGFVVDVPLPNPVIPARPYITDLETEDLFPDMLEER